MDRNVLLIPHLCLSLQKDFQQDIGHSSDLDQKQSGILRTTKRPQGECDKVAELMMIKFGESGHPVFRARVHCLEERSKAEEVENYLYTSVPMGIRLKLFFAQFFLPNSSVSTEQSQMCVKNTAAVEQGQGDLLWHSNLTHFSRQQTCW